MIIVAAGLGFVEGGLFGGLCRPQDSARDDLLEGMDETGLTVAVCKREQQGPWCDAVEEPYFSSRV